MEMGSSQKRNRVLIQDYVGGNVTYINYQIKIDGKKKNPRFLSHFFPSELQHTVGTL